MNNKSLLFSLALSSSLCFLVATASAQSNPPTTTPPAAQTTTTIPTVDVHAKGADVRDMLHDLFVQQKQNFVIEPGVHFVLWLNLDKVDFDEALDIICHEANLKSSKQDGIYYISNAPSKKIMSESNTVPPQIEKIMPPVTARDLTRKVTTRLKKADIRALFAELSTQTKVPILIDTKIPNYKLDAFLIKTSLRYALIKIDKAAGLTYKLDAQGIHITLDAPLNTVSVIK